MWRLGLFGLVLLVTQRVDGQLVLSFGAPPTQAAAAGGFDPNCADKLDNCDLFGAQSCGGQYEQWARDNCALTCKYCQGPPTTPPPCVDMLDNCAAYEDGACSDPQYLGWAKANCRRTCRMCPGVATTQKPCLDSRPNCDQYEKDMCNNPDYSIWVDDNCAQYCGRCSEVREDCADTIDDCREHGEVGCRGIYESWARARCSKFCGFCVNPKATEPPCVDVNPNCDRYGEDACTNPSYQFWAEDNCRKTCNFCNGKLPPCEDKLDYCQQFEANTCVDEQYLVWARTNCRKHCNLCAGSCQYNGQNYQEGDRWKEGWQCRCQHSSNSFTYVSCHRDHHIHITL
nr:hypothetical protein BaRGS_032191 [Batillaria attramentaria]